ncbi:MAG: hypothetical protein ACI9AV_000515 [Sediminicola sp.]|jgi:hypothetical protein
MEPSEIAEQKALVATIVLIEAFDKKGGHFR